MATNSMRGLATTLTGIALLTAVMGIASKVQVSGDFTVVACQNLNGDDANGLPSRVLVKQKLFRGLPVMGAEIDFVSGSQNSEKTIGVFRTPFLFNDMFFQAGSILVTEWVAGDRPVTEAFHLVKGGADLVFSEGSRGGFEYWDDVILRTNAAIGADGNYHPTKTELWKWDGKQYKLVATVPYHQRLGALAKLEQESPSK